MLFGFSIGSLEPICTPREGEIMQGEALRLLRTNSSKTVFKDNNNNNNDNDNNNNKHVFS